MYRGAKCDFLSALLAVLNGKNKIKIKSKMKLEGKRMTLALCIILLVVAVAICVLVMLQSDKDTKLSGTLAGGSDTFFGKNKSNDKDRKMSMATAILSAVFVVLVVVMYIIG